MNVIQPYVYGITPVGLWDLTELETEIQFSVCCFCTVSVMEQCWYLVPLRSAQIHPRLTALLPERGKTRADCDSLESAALDVFLGLINTEFPIFSLIYQAEPCSCRSCFTKSEIRYLQ